MRNVLLDRQEDAVILLARILLMLLFVIFGWQKLTEFAQAAGFMKFEGLPLPQLAAAIAVVVELGVGLAIAVGFWTKPLAVVMAVYTVIAGLIGHHYWTLSGMQRVGAMINFYKNLSIAGGLLLLSITGPGRYSIDERDGR